MEASDSLRQKKIKFFLSYTWHIHMCVAIHFVLIWLSREWIRRCFSILWDTRISVLRWIPILMLNFRMHRKIFKKQLIHNDLMKMREKWLNASIYLNPQFLTCRFPMADLPLVQTWNLPKFLPKLMTKICKDMPKYARISEKWRKVKRLEKPENTGNMRKIKILSVCYGTPVVLTFWIASFRANYRKTLWRNFFDTTKYTTNERKIMLRLPIRRTGWARRVGWVKLWPQWNHIHCGHSLNQKELLFRIPHHRRSFRQKW